MSKPLTQAKREKMFQCWCQNQTLVFIQKKFGYSEPTIRKFRKLDDWDARFNKIRTKAQTKLDKKEVDYTVEQLKIVKNVKNAYLTCLIGKTPCPHCKKSVPVPKLDPKFADIDKIIRLEELLRGKPDSRPDIGRTLEALSDDDLDKLCDVALIEFAERLREIKAMTKSKKIRKALDDLINELG